MNDIRRYRLFLALLKPKDWLKDRAKEILEKYEGRITTSEVTFIELMLLAKRYNLNLVKIASSVMAICGIEDEKLLRAAIYIRIIMLSFRCLSCILLQRGNYKLRLRLR